MYLLLNMEAPIPLGFCGMRAYKIHQFADTVLGFRNNLEKHVNSWLYCSFVMYSYYPSVGKWLAIEWTIFRQLVTGFCQDPRAGSYPNTQFLGSVGWNYIVLLGHGSSPLSFPHGTELDDLVNSEFLWDHMGTLTRWVRWGSVQINYYENCPEALFSPTIV